MGLELVRGDTRTISIAVEYADGTPFDLTGATIYFTVKRKAEREAADEDAVIQKVITTHVNAAGGLSEADVEHEDTNELELGRYVYNFRVVVDGKVMSQRASEFDLLLDVTKSVPV